MRTEVTAKSGTGRLRALVASSAPPRTSTQAVAVATAASAVALLVLAGLTELTSEPFLIPPLAASMALVAGAPQLPLSQPRNVIGGQVISALVGVLVGLAVGSAMWAGALSGALALGAMMLARMAHSPAAATAVIGTTGTAVAGWEFVILVAASAVILVIVGASAHRVNKTAYPVYLW